MLKGDHENYLFWFTVKPWSIAPTLSSRPTKIMDAQRSQVATVNCDCTDEISPRNPTKK